MEGVLERDAKMEKDADILIAQLEKYMKVKPRDLFLPFIEETNIPKSNKS